MKRERRERERDRERDAVLSSLEMADCAKHYQDLYPVGGSLETYRDVSVFRDSHGSTCECPDDKLRVCAGCVQHERAGGKQDEGALVLEQGIIQHLRAWPGT